jgi:chromosome segregation ATPase
MNERIGSVLGCLMMVQTWAGALPAHAQTPADVPLAIEKLAASVDRLAVLLEREIALRSEDREARRVEVAVGILGIRYRKIDQLEGEIGRLGRDEDEFRQQIGELRAEIEALDRQGRAEDGQLGREAKQIIDEVERRTALLEERVRGLGEKKLLLQNDLAAEQRRLSSLEAFLDAWLERLP